MLFCRFEILSAERKQTFMVETDKESLATDDRDGHQEAEHTLFLPTMGYCVGRVLK